MSGRELQHESLEDMNKAFLIWTLDAEKEKIDEIRRSSDIGGS